MKHLHLLLAYGDLLDVDAAACWLALSSCGRRTLCGDACRAERDQLGGLLVSGELAELLLSDRPITVDSWHYGYSIREVRA